MQIDMDAIGAMLAEACDTVIVPRFRALAEHQIEEKSPGETVTIADREAEAVITRHLQAMHPGVPVIGEEAVADRPNLVDALHTEPYAWLVDPLDGTSNFAAGAPHWAVLVALAHRGETVAAWTYRHLDRGLYTAERGAGCWRSDTRLHTKSTAAIASSLRGAILPRFMTEAEREQMMPQLGQFAEVTGGFKCAGFEYPAIIDGEQEFSLFQRLLPWDHAGGALLLTEAGGVAQHPDGSPFRPGHADRRGLLLASNHEIWNLVRDLLYGGSI